VGLLAGVRVADFTRLLPGAALTQLLADLGADVVKIERPGSGDDIRRAGPVAHGSSAVHLFLDRGKRSVAIDLKTRAGRDAATAIACHADAVVESFRPGGAGALGLDWETLHARNPKLVYVSLNGYGDGGPRAALAGHDINYCAYAGLLDFGGWSEEGPRVSGAQTADITGGTLGAVGLLAALLSAQRTGEGTRVTVALADAALWTIGIHVSGFIADGAPQGPRSGALNGGWPCYDVYRCADGRHLAVGALEPHFWQALLDGVGRPDLLERQFDRTARVELELLFATRSAAAWIDDLAGSDACVALVQHFDEVVSDPQFHASGMFVEVALPGGTIGQVGTPLRSPAIEAPRASAPLLVGAHTAEVLRECGVAPAIVAEIEAQTERARSSGSAS
jgi:crotonobetainyl-CoA:carnitine CoA-transferase CaiB-like acyl-CoA transferase